MFNLRDRRPHPDREQALLEISRVLILCLKRFSLGLDDVDNKAFLESIDSLHSTICDLTAAPRSLSRRLQTAKTLTILQSRREHEYFFGREKEFRELIDTISKDFQELLGESKAFDGQVERVADELDNVARLDDLRKIKCVLKSQVSTIRKEIEQRREKDKKAVNKLNQEIAKLNLDLRQARDESLTDPLTKASNRKALDQHLKALHERHLLGGPPFAILMWDVDDFKKINDTFGHQAGDSVLKTLVKHSYKMTRKEDMVARYGGEEFVVVLDGVTQKLAFRRGKQMVKSIAGMDLLFTVAGAVRRLRPTVSMGVGTVRKEDSVEQLLERVDQALYRAKRAGKNRAELEIIH